MMDTENFMLHHQEAAFIGLHLQQASRRGKSHKGKTSGCWDLDGGREGEGTALGDDRTVLELDGGEGCATCDWIRNFNCAL